MKINDDYSIELCIVEIGEDGIPGDCYGNYEQFRKEKPNAAYRFGYCIVDKDGFIPDDCNDWNDSPEEALADYYYNVE